MELLNKLLDGTTENYLAPFLWLHNEDDSLIVRELERIHDCGIGAVCIESRTHEGFCRDDWWSDVRLILDTCKRLGMKLWILDDKHFPSGYANGVFEEKYKHLRPVNILTNHIDLAGPVRSGSVLADIWLKAPTERILSAVALRRAPDRARYDGTAIDVSDGYRNGRIYFDLPEGLWSLVVFIETDQTIPPRFRVFCDKLSAEATDAYLEEVYQSHYDRFKEDFGDTLLGFFADEPAFHNDFFGNDTSIGRKFIGYPWHKNVYDRLSRLWGKNTYAMLTRLWYDFTDGSHEVVREAYMDTVSALYRDNFAGRIGKWCEDHGVMYIGHIIEDNGAHKKLGVGVAHYFRSLEGQHMAGVDVVLHQIMPGLTEVRNTGSVSYKEMDNKLNHYLLGKLASSASHIEPKKKGRAMCEIFGAFGWAEDLTFMKYLADHFLVRGVNYYVPHAFSPKENDPDCPPNFYDTGNNPQYKHFGRLMEYMNRVSSLINGGLHVPTAAVIYDAEMTWSTAEYCDNKEICKVLYDAQLDYDLIPWDRVDDIDENGDLNGEHYPVILVPYGAYLSEENRRRLARIADRAVVVGPKGIDGYPHVTLEELTEMMLPYRDVTLSSKEPYVRYYHYEKDGSSVYLLANEDITKTVRTELRLRGFAGGDYTVYDPLANRAYTRTSTDGSIPLTLAPYNLLVLLPGVSGFPAGVHVFEETVGTARMLSPTWELEVARERELPVYQKAATLDSLCDVTGELIPDFSGNMRYTASFNAKTCDSLLLDLGEVGSTAEVYVNGAHVGTRICPPYRFDITDAVRNGENTLEINVTNTSVFEKPDRFSRYMLIRASGLLGPVTLTER